MSRRKRVALGVLAAVVAAGAAGWLVKDTMAIRAIVRASSPGYEPRPAPAEVAETIEIRRDGARIRGWVIDPEVPPKGTILLLHGIRSSKEAHLPRARRFAAQGYRALLVDLRGHGESSGRWLSYGVREAPDLVTFLDAVEARGLLAPPLGVLGTSYGASIAIQLAAVEPRVTTVIAIAPFASLREVVPEYVKWRLGSAAWIASPERTMDLVDRAGRRAGFDPDDACPRCAAARMHQPLLLIHGRDDERIPWRQSQRIRDAAAGTADLVLVPGAGHLAIGSAPGVSEAVDAWLARYLQR